MMKAGWLANTLWSASWGVSGSARLFRSATVKTTWLLLTGRSLNYWLTACSAIASMTNTHRIINTNSHLPLQKSVCLYKRNSCLDIEHIVALPDVTTLRSSCCSNCCEPSLAASCATWPSWRTTWKKRFQRTTALYTNEHSSSASSNSTTRSLTMSSKPRWDTFWWCVKLFRLGEMILLKF